MAEEKNDHGYMDKMKDKAGEAWDKTKDKAEEVWDKTKNIAGKSVIK